MVTRFFVGIVFMVLGMAATSDHFMDVSESQKFDRTAPKFEATPSEHYMDVSESQKVDTSIDTPPAVAHTPGNCAKTTN